jgi:SRSO17 transposase
VLFSRKNHDRRILGLVTDNPSLSARQMIHTYNDRWRIEVYFKDGKQLLGLGQYQNISLEAAITHLHLVCFAQALLTHLAIERHGAQGANNPRRLSCPRPDFKTNCDGWCGRILRNT